jgi:membrane protease YdiL (CAAX protease family)
VRVDVTRTGGIRQAGRPIDVSVAVVTWFAAFIAGQVLSLAILSTSGETDQDLVPIPTLFAAVAATWVAYLVGAYVASRRSGTGDLAADVGMRIKPIDAIGLPIGVLTQLVLVPLVYLPLRWLWPDTFADKKLSETADKLADRASGGTMVLLVLMVCVGAPIVEEIVYRGLLQRSFSARYSHIVSWLVVAAWFAIIHFRPVEYPGLFTFGLVTGACLLLTDRLGMSWATHIAFNATGLLLAVR